MKKNFLKQVSDAIYGTTEFQDEGELEEIRGTYDENFYTIQAIIIIVRLIGVSSYVVQRFLYYK